MLLVTLSVARSCKVKKKNFIRELRLMCGNELNHRLAPVEYGMLFSLFAAQMSATTQHCIVRSQLMNTMACVERRKNASDRLLLRSH